MHPAALPEEELLKQCKVGRGRSGGPGGQHRNKVETHVTITHALTGLIGQAGERRSQHENKQVALRRLRLALAVEVRSGAAAREPSALWRGRLTKGAEAGSPGRVVCNPEHADYPALLAEAMDALRAAGWEPKGAAEAMLVTPSSMVRFLSDHAPAFERLRHERAALGLSALHAPR